MHSTCVSATDCSAREEQGGQLLHDARESVKENAALIRHGDLKIVKERITL